MFENFSLFSRQTVNVDHQRKKKGHGLANTSETLSLLVEQFFLDILKICYLLKKSHFCMIGTKFQGSPDTGALKKGISIFPSNELPSTFPGLNVRENISIIPEGLCSRAMTLYKDFDSKLFGNFLKSYSS